jgi:hypothetical protein
MDCCFSPQIETQFEDIHFYQYIDVNPHHKHILDNIHSENFQLYSYKLHFGTFLKTNKRAELKLTRRMLRYAPRFYGKNPKKIPKKISNIIFKKNPQKIFQKQNWGGVGPLV